MIRDHQSFRFADKGTGKEFFMEVNWNGDDKCKSIRVTFPNGDKVIIKRDNLNAMLFAIGTEEDQRKMIPKVETTSRWYETIVSVKATKPIALGEEITFPIKLSLPSIDKEIIAEAKRDVLKSSHNILG